MTTYYIYALIDPRDDKIFYIGKGTGTRAYQHAQFKDGNNNPYKDRKIKKIFKENMEPLVKFLYENIEDESLAYSLEESVIQQIGINNLTNMSESKNPPSRSGWKPSKETLKKRSDSLKGIPRTEEWCQRLSKAKQGKNNPMYGKKNPCSPDKQLAIIKTKNLPNYDLYKQAIELMDSGISADNVAVKLGIGRGVCFRLKNRSHLFFKAFPELR